MPAPLPPDPASLPALNSSLAHVPTTENVLPHAATPTLVSVLLALLLRRTVVPDVASVAQLLALWPHPLPHLPLLHLLLPALLSLADLASLLVLNSSPEHVPTTVNVHLLAATPTPVSVLPASSLRRVVPDVAEVK